MLILKTLYNNMDNKDIIDANKDKMQHSAIVRTKLEGGVKNEKHVEKF